MVKTHLAKMFKCIEAVVVDDNRDVATKREKVQLQPC